MTVFDQDGNAVAGTSSFDPSTNKATFTPDGLLAPSTTFTFTTSGATNFGGVALAAPFTFSFTTAAPQVILSARTPAVNAPDVRLTSIVTATFNAPVVPASVTFTVRDSAK